MSFRSSELILNPDGSVYHLALHPEQIARTVILVGDPGRVELISRHFDHIEHRISKREFITHTGYIGTSRLSVISTGIGTDNIDIVLQELDILLNTDLARREFKPVLQAFHLLRLGTSGAYQEDLEPGSVVLSKYALGLDNLMHFYDAKERSAQELVTSFLKFADDRFKLPVQPYAFEGSPLLFNHYDKQFTNKGITLTSPGFYGPQGRSLRVPLFSHAIWQHLPEFRWNNYRITNFEMETSGIYGLSAMLGHHALSINLILANRIRGTVLTSSNDAMNSMIEMVLSNLPAFPAT